VRFLELPDFQQVIRQIWCCAIQLWSYASDSNIEVIQRYRSKALKCIINVPRYVRNSDLHRDHGIETVTDIVAKFANLMKIDFKTTSTSKRPGFLP
jgi:hypothetical protein